MSQVLSNSNILVCVFANKPNVKSCEAGKSVGAYAKSSIYHLLSAAFGQRVAVAKVVDLDVLDVVAILLVDFLLQVASG